ncbi:MAG TPA: hypothetical protein VN665_01665 [Candidatus Paceibacterota bacterium]|nr:hypothetical protein [Candidatus Paceibacterota bacterium]
MFEHADLGNFTAPSGAVLESSDLSLICDLYETKSVTREEEPVTLKSGRRSNFYVHLRADLTDHPKVLGKLGYKVAKMVRNTPMPSLGRPCLIGIPTAGTAIAQAASFVDTFMGSRNGPSIFFRTMRSVKKNHGKNQTWVDGVIDLESHAYGTIENVTTTSGSLIENIGRLEEDGYPARSDMHHFIVVDRQQGAAKGLQEAGIKHVHVLFTLHDIIAAFAHLQLGEWNQSHCIEIEEECRLHR